MDGTKFSPTWFVLDHLFPRKGRAPYSATERAIVIAIVRAMGRDPNQPGAWNCFLGYSTIARYTGTNVSTVKRLLAKHCEGPAPLLARSLSGETRGYRHRCYRYTLVRDPAAFVTARNAAWAAKQEAAKAALTDSSVQRQRLELQRPCLLGDQSEQECNRAVERLERRIRAGVPKRAVHRRASSNWLSNTAPGTTPK